MATDSAATAPPGVADDVRTSGLVGLAHFTSHFLLFATAPLLPLMKDDFGVTFTELGLMLTLFYAASGALQVVAGIVVDRFGPHRLLLAGMAIQSAAVVAMGFTPSFLLLFPIHFFAAVGNCVYHPADLSILSRRISRGRQGRAFATHGMSGQFGFAASPIAVGFAAAVWGWRPALVAAGLLGLAATATLLVNRAWLRADEDRHEPAHGGEGGGAAAKTGFVEILALPVVVFGIAFFFLSALSIQGLMTFTVSALSEGYGVALALATVAVAALQFGSMGGTLIGGYLADRTASHHRVAAVGALAAAAFVVPVVYTGLPLALIVACLMLYGVFFGIALPSRDLLIRHAAPPGALGKTFGTVYSGLDGGSLLAPLVVGPMLDHGRPQLLFALGAAAMVLAVFTVAGIRRSN